MDANRRTVESFRALEEKFRVWKETHLPAGDITFVSMAIQLDALGNERLIAAYKDAEAGHAAELMLNVEGWVPMFSLTSGLCHGILRARGINVKTLN